MAVQSIPQASTVRLKVQTGVNGSGNPEYAYRTFSNAKPGAADADCYAIMQSLAGLQKYPAANIQRINYANLVNM